MSWGVKTTCFKAPGVPLGRSGVSIGGVRVRAYPFPVQGTFESMIFSNLPVWYMWSFRSQGGKFFEVPPPFNNLILLFESWPTPQTKQGLLIYPFWGESTTANVRYVWGISLLIMTWHLLKTRPPGSTGDVSACNYGVGPVSPSRGEDFIPESRRFLVNLEVGDVTFF